MKTLKLLFASATLFFIFCTSIQAQPRQRDLENNSNLLRDYQLLDHKIRKEQTSSPSDKLGVEKGGDMITCNAGGPVTFCSCKGNGSADCDLLFIECDLVGGVYSCDIDFGFPGDGCYCEF